MMVISYMPSFLFEFNKQEKNLNFKRNCIIFSPNAGGKTLLLRELNEGLSGKKKSFLIDSMPVDKNTNTVVFFDEETDFNSEFKFTNNNIFRQEIYSSIEKVINSEQILKDLNLILDQVDNKVNQYINKNINPAFTEDINFDININDLDQIINKFTDIYIDGLSSDKQLSKSKKRLLIYQLLLLNQITKDKDSYILIDDFDLYLDYSNTTKILKFISNLSKDYHCHFILTTSNPIVYSLTNNDFEIFKLAKNSKLIKLDQSSLSQTIHEFLLLKEFKRTNKKDFLNFKEENYSLITENDLKLYFKQHYFNLKTLIGILLTSNTVKFSLEANTFDENSLHCENMEQIELLKLFCDKLLTEYEIVDIL